jgi:dUTP pyrophosphatase
MERPITVSNPDWGAPRSVKILIKDAFDIPEYQTTGSAGVDIHANNRDPIMIKPGGRQLVKTGISVELPIGMEAQARPRSGLVLKHGVTVLNSPGTIDSDYRGEIGIILYNAGDKPFYVNCGDRIAQLVFAPITQVEFIEVDVLTETDRGSGGFGSTGK